MLTGSGSGTACWGGVRDGFVQREKGQEHGQTEGKHAEQGDVGHVARVRVLPIDGTRGPCVVHAISDHTRMRNTDRLDKVTTAEIV